MIEEKQQQYELEEEEKDMDGGWGWMVVLGQYGRLRSGWSS